MITPEAVVRRCSAKRVFLKISQTSQEYICFSISYLRHMPPALQLYYKRDSNTAQVFSCEIFNHNYFVEHL